MLGLRVPSTSASFEYMRTICSTSPELNASDQRSMLPQASSRSSASAGGITTATANNAETRTLIIIRRRPIIALASFKLYRSVAREGQACHARGLTSYWQGLARGSELLEMDICGQ